MKAKVLFAVLAISLLLAGSAWAATISGNVYLDGETDHSGVNITFFMGGGGEAAATSAADGSYSESLWAYDEWYLRFYKPGFAEMWLGPYDLAADEDLVVGDITLPTSTEISGAVSGPLTLGPGYYHVSGDYTVQGDVTIEPGTIFQCGYGVQITFDGNVTAVGTETDPIEFEGIQGAWYDGVYCSDNEFSLSRTHTLAHWTMEEAGTGAPATTPLKITGSTIAVSHVELGQSYTTIQGQAFWIDHADIATVDNLVAIDYSDKVVFQDIGALSFDNSSVGYNLGISLLMMDCPDFTFNNVTVLNDDLYAITCTRSNGAFNGSHIDGISFNADGGFNQASFHQSTVGVQLQVDTYSLTFEESVVYNPGTVTLDDGSTFFALNSTFDTAFALNAGSFSTFINSILYRPAPAVGLTIDAAADAEFSHTDVFTSVQGTGPAGFLDMTSTNANGDPCDVYNNIALDPQFVDAANHDYHLIAGSPAIDAGDPLYTDDPDGTVRDLGAYYFDQNAGGGPVSITLFPANPPVTVPQGGSFLFDAIIENTLANPQTVNVWVDVLLPNGNEYHVATYNQVLQPGVPRSYTDVSQSVPVDAQTGTYEFIVRVGLYPNYVGAEDSFPVEVIAANLPGGADGWSLHGLDADLAGESAGAAVNLPVDYALEQAYPNPFNPSTTIAVALPDAADLTVAVYNVEGRRVAELTSGRHSAGRHAFSFDARSLASGVYFVRASVPGELNATRKIVLMK